MKDFGCWAFFRHPITSAVLRISQALFCHLHSSANTRGISINKSLGLVESLGINRRADSYENSESSAEPVTP